MEGSIVTVLTGSYNYRTEMVGYNFHQTYLPKDV